MPGWGHWALPQDNMQIDHELHHGEFLAHQDMVAPLDENAQLVVENLQLGDNNCNITASSAPALQSANTTASANGPLGPPIEFPDLNLLDGLQGEEHLAPPGPLILPAVPVIGWEDSHLPAVIMDYVVTTENSNDPMLLEASTVFVGQNTATTLPLMLEDLQAIPLPEENDRGVSVLNPSLIDTSIVAPETDCCNFNQQTAMAELVGPEIEHIIPDISPIEIQQTLNPVEQGTSGTHGGCSSDTSAPPGFPDPVYLPLCEPQSHADKDVEDLVGKEGSIIWKKHFAPTMASMNIIQVPSDWVNFLFVTLLSPDKYDWAKQFLTSKVWGIITQ